MCSALLRSRKRSDHELNIDPSVFGIGAKANEVRTPHRLGYLVWSCFPGRLECRIVLNPNSARRRTRSAFAARSACSAVIGRAFPSTNLASPVLTEPLD